MAGYDSMVPDARNLYDRFNEALIRLENLKVYVSDISAKDSKLSFVSPRYRKRMAMKFDLKEEIHELHSAITKIENKIFYE